MDLFDFQEETFDESYCPKRLIEFKRYRETMKGSSLNTIKSYTLDIIILLKYLKVKRGLVNKGTDFKDIKIDDIDDAFLNSITLEDMYSFELTIENNFATELDTPKIGKRKPKYMSLEEANRLLDSIQGRNAERDRLIITIFLNCGLRLAELCSIDVDSIKDDMIRIIGKGNKERTVYLNDACFDAINTYLPIREEILKKNNNEEKALILSERGNRIARRSVQEVIERRLKASGLSGLGYSTHKLRHTSATLMYKYGDVDILLLKEILGHENVATTQIYTHTDNEMLRQAVKVNPLNKKK